MFIPPPSIHHGHYLSPPSLDLPLSILTQAAICTHRSQVVDAVSCRSSVRASVPSHPQTHMPRAHTHSLSRRRQHHHYFHHHHYYYWNCRSSRQCRIQRRILSCPTVTVAVLVVTIKMMITMMIVVRVYVCSSARQHSYMPDYYYCCCYCCYYIVACVCEPLTPLHVTAVAGAVAVTECQVKRPSVCLSRRHMTPKQW